MCDVFDRAPTRNFGASLTPIVSRFCCVDQRVPIKAAHTGKDRSRHHEDFLRIRIFNRAPGRVSTDVDQPSVGIEWIVDKTGFPWDRFRHRKLRLI